MDLDAVGWRSSPLVVFLERINQNATLVSFENDLLVSFQTKHGVYIHASRQQEMKSKDEVQEET